MKNLAQAKKIAISLTALAVIPFLTGCTQDEVNTGVGIVAIGAGIALVAAGAAGDGNDKVPNNPPPPPPGGFDNRGPGRGGFGDRGPGDRGPGRGPRGSVALTDAMDTMKVVAPAQSVNRAAFAKVFSISQGSANLFLTAMEKTKAGDQAALPNLGLTAQDTNALKSFELPSESSIRLVAKNIKADSGATREMIASLIAKAKEQQSNIASQSGGN